MAIARVTLKAVYLIDVLDGMGFSDDAVDIRDYGFTGAVTWGDALHTLVRPSFALGRILMALDRLDHEHTEDDVTERFWKIVGDGDLIDLED
jgi:hypothetical protein